METATDILYGAGNGRLSTDAEPLGKNPGLYMTFSMSSQEMKIITRALRCQFDDSSEPSTLAAIRLYLHTQHGFSDLSTGETVEDQKLLEASEITKLELSVEQWRSLKKLLAATLSDSVHIKYIGGKQKIKQLLGTLNP